MSDILLTLAQATSMNNEVIDKVKNKGYAVAANLGALAEKDEVAKTDLASALVSEIEGKANSADLGDLAALDEVAETDLASALATKINGKLDADDVLSYTIKKQSTAETGYSSTYQLFSVDSSNTETAVGEKINIPKDMVVESGTVETVTTADQPYQGAVVGDKYIDLVIANKSSSHIYIPVTDLVDEYTAGNGLSLSNGEFSVNLGTNTNGLSVGANGLELAAATTSAAGAMSASDKTKLDGADVTAYTGTGAVDVTNHVISVGAASGSAAGTMSAADYTKLANIEIATAAQVQEAINNLHSL